jgi:hypothetical protein
MVTKEAVVSRIFDDVAFENPLLTTLSNQSPIILGFCMKTNRWDGMVWLILFARLFLNNFILLIADRNNCALIPAQGILSHQATTNSRTKAVFPLVQFYSPCKT